MSDSLWHLVCWLPVGWSLTIAIETPVLLWGLSSDQSRSDRLHAGVALTSCTYPVVACGLPVLLGRWQLSDAGALGIMESYAFLVEVLLFHVAYEKSDSVAIWIRNSLMVVLANAASCGTGLVLWRWVGWPGT